MPVFALLWRPEGLAPALLGYGLVIAMLVVFAHRSNIQRMRDGSENREHRAINHSGRCHDIRTGLGMGDDLPPEVVQGSIIVHRGTIRADSSIVCYRASGRRIRYP